MQPEYITNVTLEVHGDSASGAVEFGVLKLYNGRVHYTARWLDGAWRIQEFQLSNYGISIRRDAGGKWQRMATGDSDKFVIPNHEERNE